MKIYLAGIISGRSYDEVVSIIEQKRAVLSPYYEILSPMTGKEYLRNEIEFKQYGYDNPVSTNHAIFERDKWMIGQCDIALIDLIGAGIRVSIGCLMELAIASYLGKHTIIVMEKESINCHAFVLEAADIVFESLDEAYEYLRKLSKGSE